MFKDQNLFVTYDLTRTEMQNVVDISKMLKSYYSTTFIPTTSFSRDKYKGTIDGDRKRVILLDRDEV